MNLCNVHILQNVELDGMLHHLLTVARDVRRDFAASHDRAASASPESAYGTVPVQRTQPARAGLGTGTVPGYSCLHKDPRILQ